jgi:8-oxo-dGTP diphosphatase
MLCATAPERFARVAYPCAPVARRKLKPDDAVAPDITAAGGVVLRREGGDTRVAVVHRPKYMDWSLPKGKLEKGEGFEQAALREVREETGFRCEALEELPPVSYLDRKARTKLVRYWLMAPGNGSFEPHSEVDELRWVTGREARELLTYEHDRELVRRALRMRRWRRLRGLLPGSADRWPV